MLAILWLGKKLTEKPRQTLSPYSKVPLRRANTLRYTTLYKIKRYLVDMEDYNNRVFDINYAALDRDTGRIFPDCVSLIGKIALDWSFLQKRKSGNWVSWGSLPDDRKQDLFDKHGTLNEFQTEFSCPHPLPKDIEKPYVYAKPGPLYVNLENDEIMGWKIIPGTDLEILVVKETIKHI